MNENYRLLVTKNPRAVSTRPIRVCQLIDKIKLALLLLSHYKSYINHLTIKAYNYKSFIVTVKDQSYKCLVLIKA